MFTLRFCVIQYRPIGSESSTNQFCNCSELQSLTSQQVRLWRPASMLSSTCWKASVHSGSLHGLQGHWTTDCQSSTDQQQQWSCNLILIAATPPNCNARISEKLLAIKCEFLTYWKSTVEIVTHCHHKWSCFSQQNIWLKETGCKEVLK